MLTDCRDGAECARLRRNAFAIRELHPDRPYGGQSVEVRDRILHKGFKASGSVSNESGAKRRCYALPLLSTGVTRPAILARGALFSTTFIAVLRARH